MNSHTSIFYDQQLLAIKLADIYNSEIKKRLKTLSKKKTVFPTTESIYSRDVVIELNPIKEERTYKNIAQKNKKKYNDEYYDNYFTNEYDNTNNNTFTSNKIIGSSSNSNKFIIEYDKKENENLSDNNFQLTREKSENLSTLLNKANKKSEFVNNKNIPEAFNSATAAVNSKFISKSKSPITIKKKTISFIEEKEKNFDGNISIVNLSNNNNIVSQSNNNNSSNNYFNSPSTTCKLNTFENNATHEKNKQTDKKLNESNKVGIGITSGFEEKYSKIELKDENKTNNKNINNSYNNNNKKSENNEKEKAKEEIIDNNLTNPKEEEIKIEVKPILKLYRKWERSRFSFANKNANLNNISFSEDINNTNKTIENNLNNIIMDKDEDTKSNFNNRGVTLNSLVNSKNGNKSYKSPNTQFESNRNNNKNGFKNNNETYKKIELIDSNKTNNNNKNEDFEEEEEKLNNENLNNNSDDQNDIVPDYVYDVIRKKISRHTFFKNLEKEFFNNTQTDFLYFEKDLNLNDSWSQFILNNLEKPKIK